MIDENGKHLGTIETTKALEMARAKGLDLVEIDPKVDPPIVKILDFGRFKYELKRKDRQQKKQHKAGGIKGIRLTPRIGKHDLELRVTKAREFLLEKQKIKIEMVLRGREKAHFDLAEKLVKHFIELLGEEIKIEQPPKRQGSRLIAVISPTK
ncbi:translation initiation factor IF-3 [Patescibacteria group bacterium]|nr:translation initiation factor IF-3 [Patescibacteria group bacterium]